MALSEKEPDAFCDRRKRLCTFLRGGVLFVTVAGLIAFFHLGNLHALLDPPAWVQANLVPGQALAGPKQYEGILLFIALAAFFSPLGVPRQALSLLGGYAFGALAGTLWTLVGLTLGCACGFFYARLLARPLVQKKFSHRIARLNSFLCHNPFAMAMAIRLLPMGNNALTSMLAGVTEIPALPFIFGSGLGYLPQTAIFALLGSGLGMEPFWRILAAAVLFVFASFISFRIYKRYKGEQLLALEQDED